MTVVICRVVNTLRHLQLYWFLLSLPAYLKLIVSVPISWIEALLVVLNSILNSKVRSDMVSNLL